MCSHKLRNAQIERDEFISFPIIKCANNQARHFYKMIDRNTQTAILKKGSDIITFSLNTGDNCKKRGSNWVLIESHYVLLF